MIILNNWFEKIYEKRVDFESDYNIMPNTLIVDEETLKKIECDEDIIDREVYITDTCMNLVRKNIMSLDIIISKNKNFKVGFVD
ncbi:MAG: hypothetical protein R6U40_05235 [Desulfobacterales bacterium]